MTGYSKNNIENYTQESTFDEKKKKPRLKFNPGLALIGFVTTGPWSLVHKQGPPRSHIMIRSSLKSHDCILWCPATCMVSLFLTVITMMSLPFVPRRELSRRAQKYQLLVQIYQLLSLLQAGQKRETLIERIESLVGSKGGPVMNAFASHHHSNPGVDTICGF